MDESTPKPRTKEEHFWTKVKMDSALQPVLVEGAWETIGLTGSGKSPHRTSIKTLVDQNVDILWPFLLQLIASREGTRGEGSSDGSSSSSNLCLRTIKDQLHRYVETIASLYNHVDFHSFEHASHVLASASKMMQTLAAFDNAPVTKDYSDSSGSDDESPHRRQDESWRSLATFGLCDDAFTQFVFVFAALVHDVEHLGVTNRQLVSEGHELAVRFDGRSVAEQNSICVSLNRLLQPEFPDLQKAIFSTVRERIKFLSLLRSLILTTDICSPEQLQVVHGEWDKAFVKGTSKKKRQRDSSRPLSVDHRVYDPEKRHRPSVRRHSIMGRVDTTTPTLVDPHTKRRHSTCLYAAGPNSKMSPIAHEEVSEPRGTKANASLLCLMQACDVAHTMQDFGVFVKWNERLYNELWQAYRSGHGNDAFAANWYLGQISFFDGYVIPLIEKIQCCGVLGSTFASRLLRNALENRTLWILHGPRLTKRFVTGAP